MFEFHGWVRLTADDVYDEDLSTIERENAIVENAVRGYIGKFQGYNGICEVRITGNNFRLLIIHGLSNHRNEEVIDLYRWIGEHFPACYGLLYIWDDEDVNRTDEDFLNCFRVWRLARGRLTEEADPFLSPCIPTIELPLQE